MQFGLTARQSRTRRRRSCLDRGNGSALVAAGVRNVAPIGWVGDDADGRLYQEALSSRGVRADGVAIEPGRTPICVLAYQPDGGCYCLYHPSLQEPLALNVHQREIVAGAQWVCLTVGPAEATAQALAATRPDAQLVWGVKADPRAMPQDLAAAIAARADIVTANSREIPFLKSAIAAAKPSGRRRLIVETRGTEGIALIQGGDVKVFPVEPAPVEDSTGAGDTFLGGFLSALIAGVETPGDAVAAGAKAARDLLLARQAQTQRDS
jgi:ribokinase